MATGPTGMTGGLKRVFRSTKNQLIVIMLILVISTGIIATAVSTFHAKADMEGQIFHTMDAVAHDTVDQLQVIFIAGTDNANQLALNSRVIDLLETEKRTGIDQQKRLALVPELDTVVKKTSDMITDIRVVNRDGDVIAANYPSLIGKNERKNPVFSRGLLNTTISDPFRNEEDVPFISYAAPVIGSENETLGAVIVSGPMGFVEKNVLQPDNLGESGQVYLVNQEGSLISGTSSDSTAFLNERADLSRIQVHNVSSFTDYRGHQVVGMAAPLSKKSWTVIVTEDESEAMAPVQNLIVSMIFLITCLVVIDGSVAWYIARNIAGGERALLDSERRLTDIINFLPDATLAIDCQGTVIAWNRAIEEMTGVKSADMLGKGNFAYAVPFYGERRPILIDLIFEPDEKITKKYSGIIHKSGNLLIAETLPQIKGKSSVLWAIASPLYDETGRVVGAIESIRDITDRKQAEEALRLANKKITMLSSITRHDIRNQLLALRGFLGLSRMKERDPELLGFIRKEERAAEAIGNQIEFTKYYEDIGVKAPEWQDIPDLIHTARSQLPVPDTIEVTVDLPPVKVFADGLIEKVFYNLMENTLRHGKKVSRIRFSFQETEGGAEIVYEDDGVGISQEDKPHLFEKGFGKNTGLGLFLSQEILAITGLTLRETGEPGKGARFEITVPRDGYRFTNKQPST